MTGEDKRGKHRKVIGVKILRDLIKTWQNRVSDGTVMFKGDAATEVCINELTSVVEGVIREVPVPHQVDNVAVLEDSGP